MKKKFSIVILVTLLIIALSSGLVYSATGTTRLYYFTGADALGPGTTLTIGVYLTNMGYTYLRSANAGVSAITSALSSRKVVHILAHGFHESDTVKGSGLQCVAGSANPSDWIWANNLTSSMSQAELILWSHVMAGVRIQQWEDWILNAKIWEHNPPLHFPVILRHFPQAMEYITFRSEYIII